MLPSSIFAAARQPSDLYEVPKFGNVTLLHITDTHAQLNPIWFREPNVNIGIGPALGQAPHVVGEACSSTSDRAGAASRPMPSPSSTSTRRPRSSAASAASPT
jgi:2',3'-cyclic-nucleotide 2'-phosphodiesterase (5'-nucleotidase family)